MKNNLSIFWFRRDLRLEDNVGLYHALASEYPVLPIFIFDEAILTKLEDKKDRRVDYIQQALVAINNELEVFGATLNTFYGDPLKVLKMLCEKYAIQCVFSNCDYEPSAIKRDTKIYKFFKEQNIPFRAFKDQVIFHKGDVVKNDGSPYTVYTPYSKKWKELLTEECYRAYNPDFRNFFKQKSRAIHSLSDLNFVKTDVIFKSPKLVAKIIDEYDKFRDFPAMHSTTGLSIALRFGTISIRKCVAFAVDHNPIWLNELIWREFFMQILYHFPEVVKHSFKRKYDNIKWRDDEQSFEKWCKGETGYPIVDAGMRQLNETGFMHNRVRMIVASFLCKHLLIDWRWGEAYFAQKLNDYDLSANNGNWQWASGSGCDAAPYFRVFNPILQMEKFDPNKEYVRKWVPKFETDRYAMPIIEHKLARDRALKTYKEGLQDNNL